MRLQSRTMMTLISIIRAHWSHLTRSTLCQSLIVVVEVLDPPRRMKLKSQCLCLPSSCRSISMRRRNIVTHFIDRAPCSSKRSILPFNLMSTRNLHLSKCRFKKQYHTWKVCKFLAKCHQSVTASALQKSCLRTSSAKFLRT